MKRAILMGIISMFLCISTFVGTTFAWFSDSVTSNKNQIVAGNLDVELSYWTKANKWESVNGKSDVFDPNAYWEPCRTEVVYLQISNECSLAMKYRFTIDIFGETLGRTVGSNADNIRLSDYLQFGFVQGVEVGDLETRAAALAAVETQWSLQEALKHQHGQGMLTGQMEKGAQPKIFAVVLWMPTTVGNEANCDGVHIPSVDIGVTLVATQLANEDDSFDDQYDAEAPLPITGTGTATVTDDVATEVEVRVGGGKIATALVHKDSIADDAEEIVMTVEETSVNENVTVESDELARTFEVTVTGIKEDNPEAIKVQIRVGEGLSNPRVYHYDTLINSTYSGEYIIFETKDFSPFTVVYDQEPAVSPDQPDLPEIPDDPNVPADLPVANVSRATEYENTDLEWESFGGFSPTAGLDNHLEAAYTFAAVDDETTVENSPYKDWYCDFYVKLDRDLGENQIFLGGNYGSFGWIGFHNGDITLKANEEIPLLGSVTQNPWTYESIVSFVGTFICGVGDVDDALAGATFTVMLRLTNPENESEYYNVATINYTFEA